MQTAELVFRVSLLILLMLVAVGFIAGCFSVAESGIAMSFAGLSTILHEVIK